MYEFLEKAKAEPDLQDVVKYLDRPLIKLEEIIIKVNNNKNIDNNIILKKANIIRDKHLQQLISEYCSFSFEYRNTKIIKQSKTDNISYTAKELLLENLAKIVEEINLLEEEFNENKKIDFLTQNRIFSQLGNPLELLPANQKTQLKFENKFNYQQYNDNYIFTQNKEEPKVTKEIQEKITPNKEPYDPLKVDYVSIASMIGGASIIVGIIALSVGFFKDVHWPHPFENSDYTSLVETTNKIDKNLSTYFVQNAQITQQNIKPDFLNPIANSFKGITQVTSYNEVTKQYDLKITNVPSRSCEYFTERFLYKGYLVSINKNTVAPYAQNNYMNVDKFCSRPNNDIILIGKKASSSLGE